MSRPAPIHICFYSNRCEWSKAFITEISQTNYHKEFRFVCVDPSPNRPQLPSWLKQTPTLVISGDPEPKTNADVMNWLYERKMRDGVGNKSQSNSGSGAPQGPLEPEPYLDSEMGGNIGNSYSFVNSDWSAQGDGGMTIANNFSFLNGSDSVGTKEASNFQSGGGGGGSSSQSKTKKEKLLDQQMEQYMKSRDVGIPQRIARM
jgi:hypothetical protein